MNPPSCQLGVPTDQLGVNPMLGPLQANGGPTATRALLPGSPAIDKGNSVGEGSDQRAFTRPIDFPGLADAAGGDGSDIGAFELAQACSGQATPSSSCTPPAPTPTPAAATGGTGEQAAALKKCKKKKKGKARKKCKKKALKLPL
jgi:hypothetical protein